MGSKAPRSQDRTGHLHPLLMLLGVILAAVILTHLLPSGRFDQSNGHSIPGTYHVIPKTSGLEAVFSTVRPDPDADTARAAGIFSTLSAIPAGIAKSAPVMFMIMFVGGLFGILQVTGIVDSGINKLLYLFKGNTNLLAIMLMVLMASGATFVGLYSQYLAIVPVMIALGERLRWPNLLSIAMIVLPGMVGYGASVTNPVVLIVAQSLANVPLFSGVIARLLIFVALLIVSIGYVQFHLRKLPKAELEQAAVSLTGHQYLTLGVMAAGIVLLIAGPFLWSWDTNAFSAMLIGWAVALAAAGGLAPSAAADSFIDGMKMMVLPSILIGLAGSLTIVLESSQVLDGIVQEVSLAIRGQVPGVVAVGIMALEAALDSVIASATAKAATTLPIVVPIAQAAGLDGNVCVTALTLGSLIVNVISPASPGLLVFLSAGKVGYGEWLRFILPLFIAFMVICTAAIYLMATLA